MMEAHEARRISECNTHLDYGKAVKWIRNAAARGEFDVRLYRSEFKDLTQLHDKFVVSGFTCLLFNDCLEVSW